MFTILLNWYNGNHKSLSPTSSWEYFMQSSSQGAPLFRTRPNARLAQNRREHLSVGKDFAYVYIVCEYVPKLKIWIKYYPIFPAESHLATHDSLPNPYSELELSVSLSVGTPSYPTNLTTPVILCKTGGAKLISGTPKWESLYTCVCYNW